MSGRIKCSFSIEHILNVAGSSPPRNQLVPLHFDWLSCTRYRPPRIQRPKKKDGAQRRNPGRNPRIPFSPAQVAMLENKFQQTPYLSSHEVQRLAASLQLSEMRVKIWFQNRRARERREQDMIASPKTQESWTKGEKMIREVSLSPETAPSQTQPSSSQITKTEKSCELPQQEDHLPSTPSSMQSTPFSIYPDITSQSRTLEHNLSLKHLGWLFKN